MSYFVYKHPSCWSKFVIVQLWYCVDTLTTFKVFMYEESTFSKNIGGAWKEGIVGHEDNKIYLYFLQEEKSSNCLFSNGFVETHQDQNLLQLTITKLWTGLNLIWKNRNCITPCISGFLTLLKVWNIPKDNKRNYIFSKWSSGETNAGTFRSICMGRRIPSLSKSINFLSHQVWAIWQATPVN